MSHIRLSGSGPESFFPGDHSERATPVPIPNTEVKPLSADGTAGYFCGRVGRRQVFLSRPQCERDFFVATGLGLRAEATTNAALDSSCDTAE